jgi:hypothetical protein
MATEIISRADAKAKGLIRYFTGKHCKHGHIAERIISNGCCLECRNLIEKKWYDGNRDKLRKKWKRQSVRHRIENPERIKKNNKWELANPAKVAARIRKWRQNNPERFGIQQKRWRDANPEKIAKKNKRYKAKHAERLRPIAIARTTQWRENNPDQLRVNSEARRARKQKAPGSHTVEQIKALLESQNWQCVGCGRPLRQKRHLDHKIPLSRGGSNDISNLQWLCPSCNCSKHNKDYAVWAAEVGLSS